jgi:hypothetical protein
MKLTKLKLKEIIREEIHQLIEFDAKAYDAKMKKYVSAFKKALTKEVGRIKGISNLKFIKYKFSGTQSGIEFKLDFDGVTFIGAVQNEGGGERIRNNRVETLPEKIRIEVYIKGKGIHKWYKSGGNASPERAAQSIGTFFESGGKKK